MTPHGLLVAEKLKIPKASLVTYPGMGSLSELMSHTERLQRAAEIRKPLGDEIQKVFGVDLQAWGAGALGGVFAEAPMNFITTCEDLVAPLPEDAPWAEELRTHCSFIPVLSRAKSFGHGLPAAELSAQLAQGHKIVFAALGTMALSDRWAIDLGRASGGNLPLGTTGKQYCQHVWKALLEAMEELGEDYYCVLSAGKQPDALDFLEDDDDDYALPQNVIVRTFVPQVEMLNHYTSVFLSHVGFNSLQESLMAGVPLVAVPQAVDQPANARKVESCGWGVSFFHPMSSVSGPALASALRAVGGQQGFHAAVAEAKADLQGGAERLTEKLLEL
ncbi:Uncharacterized UDP-glucosyltransferase YjiC [Durusdinium trenchii]|uniref:Uncharacterized UDP-glucosyltransferase YjiC n=1 Tax=Durusdinium trenchii TaxID=1381693 RepID=A0ABP0LE91_9DINO